MEKKSPKSNKIKKIHGVSKLLLVFLIFSPILLFFSISAIALYASPNEYAPWVSWFDDPSERVYISWKTKEKTKAVIYYGTDENDLSDQIKESKEQNLHHVILNNLSANTQYYYEIKIDGKSFGSGQFRTAPLTYKSFTFGLISDTQQNVGLGYHSRVANVIKGMKWAFIANVGDLTDEGDEESYYNNFFQVGAEYLDTIPLVPVVGNHDKHAPSLFMDYFINNKYTSKEQFFYSFNWSNVHFQICDFPYGSGEEFTDEQLNWMEYDLANAIEMPFRIVMFHRPIIGSSFFGRCKPLIERVLPILEEYNVDVVIHGHEHHYERGFLNDDLMYMIIGGAGGQLDPGLNPQPESDVAVAMPCYTQVHVTDDTLEFQTFSLQNELIDEITLEEK